MQKTNFARSRMWPGLRPAQGSQTHTWSCSFCLRPKLVFPTANLLHVLIFQFLKVSENNKNTTLRQRGAFWVMACDQINQIQKRKKNVLLKANNLNSSPCLWHDDFMLVSFLGHTFFPECHKIRIFQSLLILSPHFPTQVCTLSIERHVLNAWKRLSYNHWLKYNPSCNPNK